MIDADLRERVRSALGAIVVPDVPLARRSTRVARIRSALMVAAAVVFVVAGSLVIGRILIGYRSDRAASTAAGGLASAITRDEAMAMVRGESRYVGRVDRIEAKLLTRAELEQWVGPPRVVGVDGSSSVPRIELRGSTGTDSTPVWVVGVAGEVWPQGREPIYWNAPVPPHEPNAALPWGVFVVDATNGSPMSVVDAGRTGAWPDYFTSLPDHLQLPALGPTPLLSPLRTKVARLDAINAAVSLETTITRPSRIDAKLLTWAEVSSLAATSSSRLPPDAVVYVVAIGADVGRTEQDSRWSMYVATADGSSVFRLIGGLGQWPPAFDRLPNHRAAGD